MTQDLISGCTAFSGQRRIASGSLMHVALAAKTVADHDPVTTILVFDDATSGFVELDLRGSPDDVRERVLALLPERSPGAEATSLTSEAAPRKGPGRPKLGVVSKEVTLLPRHWAWLGAQRGSASATLRRLIEHARREEGGADRKRQSQDSAYRFMSAMLGNEPGFEEATRALFAGDRAKFFEESDAWPLDLKVHAQQIANRALPDASQSQRA
ncbi:MAG: DUF2239 family protein [Gemmatimonadetes bacterium]|nr:DUF2239 family protein [Gemmatimonadota bacterium]